MSVDPMRDPELVIGLVAPVGVDLDTPQSVLDDLLKQFRYKPNFIRLSEKIKAVKGLKNQVRERSEFQRIETSMTAGNEIRASLGRGDAIAGLAVGDIYNNRVNDKPLKRTAHILRSLKHPDEIKLLRDIYGDGFYLIGITSSRENRRSYLTKRKGMTEKQAIRLIERDKQEDYQFGQHMADAFHLADGFVDVGAKNAEKQIGRILDLIFGHPYLTPSKDEYAMFLAVAASLRSSDLSRQVGAVIMSPQGDVIATGTNDVPTYGGGLYWEDDPQDQRDFVRKCDSNEKQRKEIGNEVLSAIEKEANGTIKFKNGIEGVLKRTALHDITEYGRAVHAEMEALLSCARSGVSTRKATLYCTTFPCHNCAKHIVAAGIDRVVFIEPYPKSQALTLHDDSTCFEHESISNTKRDGKVRFEPYVGVGPKRFMDLFSMRLGRGNNLTRKREGKTVKWNRRTARLRVPLLPVSYIEKEMQIQAQLAEKIKGRA